MERLSYLLEGIPVTLPGGGDAVPLPKLEITALVSDTRAVVPGCLFVCIAGGRFDSHDAAAQVALDGAAVLVVEREVALPDEVHPLVLMVKSTRYALACLAAAWFHHPARHLKTIGITGTKGKSTTTYLVKSILEHAGFKVGLIGTIEAVIGDRHIPALNTTPGAYELQSDLAEMVQEGCDAVVMEVSSQALMQHRTQGFVFDIGVFTNLEPDHIGPNEHASFEEYLHCKGLLFRQCRVGIVNCDDPHWKAVTKGHTCSLETYGLSEQAQLRASALRLTGIGGSLGVAFHVDGRIDMDAQIDMPGRFSVYNALTAIAICLHFKVDREDIRDALKHARVRGRIERVEVSDRFSVLIDYAHNAMALKSLLTTLKEYETGRLVCVFGCGGNRSRQRRFEMGEVSGRLADFTVITSDNPRDEEPQEIIDDIVTGISGTGGSYIAICDRREAVRYAVTNAQPGDIIVIAGKGHEDYQEIRGVKYHMDDKELVLEAAGLLHAPE